MKCNSWFRPQLTLIHLITFSILDFSCVSRNKNSNVLVTQGQVASGSTFLPQVLVVIKDLGGGISARCTGTLIGPHHVISAAHCVTDPKLNGNMIAGITNKITPIAGADLAVAIDGVISVKRSDSPQQSGREIKAKRIIIPRGYYERYDGNGRLKPAPVPGDFDLSIIELAEDYSEVTQFATLATPSNAPDNGMDISVYGYGCNDTNASSSMVNMGKQQFGLSKVFAINNKTLTIGGRQDFARQCQGDSGGPSFKIPTSDLLLVGIHSTKAGDQRTTPEGYDVNVAYPEVTKFISEALFVQNSTLNPSNSPTPTPTPPLNQNSNNQDQNSLDTAAVLWTTNVGRGTDGQLKLYLYASQAVSDIQIKAGDGNWYGVTTPYIGQVGWPIIRSINLSERWLSQTSVLIRATYNQQIISRELPLNFIQ